MFCPSIYPRSRIPATKFLAAVRIVKCRLTAV
jgi:hypothetical protein